MHDVVVYLYMHMFASVYLDLPLKNDTRFARRAKSSRPVETEPSRPLSRPIIVKTWFRKRCHFSSLLVVLPIVLPLVETPRHLVLSFLAPLAAHQS